MQAQIDIEKPFLGRRNVTAGVAGSDALSAVNKILHRNRISLQDKAKICLELSVMLQAGVTLHRSLQVLLVQTDKRSLRGVLQKLVREVQKGDSFSAALGRHPDVFDPLFITSAEVGQESGKLPQVMSNLALYLEKMSVLKRKFLQALAYPALVLSIAVSVVSFLLLVIVPAFAEMFTSMKVELPAATRFTFGLSRWLTCNGYLVILGAAALMVLLRQFFTSKRFRSRTSAYIYRAPVVGGVLLKNLVARFCRTLGTLLQAQVSLVRALEVTQRIMTNEGIKNEVGRIATLVKQGKAIAEPVLSSRFFPPMVSQMIAVGEETSELDAMLFKVAEYYEKEVDGTVDSLSSVMEPILIMVIGTIVATIVISMYLPMFEMMNVVG